MLTYSFENRGKDSLYESLYKQIRKDIQQGKLKAKEKLPSKRALAKHLNISTITVENAYMQLVAEGYITSIPKSGYYVCDVDMVKYGIKKNADVFISSKKEEEYFADFLSNEMLVDNFPFSTWTKLTKETLSESTQKLMKRSPSIGLIELRKAIANYLYQFRGMEIHPDQIVVGAGTEYLYSLLIQLLGKDKVFATEDPGYQKIKKIYTSFNVETKVLEMDEEGILVKDLYESDVDILHISPSHHFPSGIIMPIGRRLEILKWALDKDGRYIIEDEYDSEFRMSGKPIPSLQSIDINDKVIYINTFSKTLTSTIRISYMILPKKLMNMYQEKLNFYSCTVSNFEQILLSKFIEQGYFEKHINRMKTFYRTQRDKLIDCIQNHSESYKVEIKEENAGLHFLLKVHTSYSDEELIKKAKEKGIRLSFLTDYTMYPNAYKNTIVLNYSGLEPNKIEEAVNRLYSIL